MPELGFLGRNSLGRVDSPHVEFLSVINTNGVLLPICYWSMLLCSEIGFSIETNGNETHQNLLI